MLLSHVDAELIGDETDDVGRQHLHMGLHAHRLQFLQEGLAPTHQRLRGDARIVRQLLFSHCFHKILSYLLLTSSNSFIF